jgi:hypothetical protein
MRLIPGKKLVGDSLCTGNRCQFKLCNFQLQPKLKNKVILDASASSFASDSGSFDLFNGQIGNL